MLKNKREFIMNDLMVSGFIEHENQEIFLVENEETGKSELRVRLQSKDNLCIANADEKKTELLGERISFSHIPVQMVRNEKDVLVGDLTAG